MKGSLHQYVCKDNSALTFLTTLKYNITISNQVSVFSSPATLAHPVKMSSPIDVPVVIIGGGGSGLTASIFLSDLNVEHVLFEKHPGTSILPKAHYLNQRTMETFRQHGIDKALKGVACPTHNMSRIEWKTSLGGNEVYDGRVLGHCAGFGGEFGTPAYETYRYSLIQWLFDMSRLPDDNPR